MLKERLKEIFGNDVRLCVTELEQFAYVRLNNFYDECQIKEMVKEFEEDFMVEDYFFYEPSPYTHFKLKKKDIFKVNDDVNPNVWLQKYLQSQSRIAFQIVDISHNVPIINNKRLYKRVLIKKFRDYYKELCNMKYLTYIVEE